VFGEVESVRVLIGLLMRLSCCGMRRVVVRIACMDVLICFALMMDLGEESRGLYTEEVRVEKHYEKVYDAWTCASRNIVMLLECCRDILSWNLSNLEEVRRNFGNFTGHDV